MATVNSNVRLVVKIEWFTPSPDRRETDRKEAKGAVSAGSPLTLDTPSLPNNSMVTLTCLAQAFTASGNAVSCKQTMVAKNVAGVVTVYSSELRGHEGGEQGAYLAVTASAIGTSVRISATVNNVPN